VEDEPELRDWQRAADLRDAIRMAPTAIQANNFQILSRIALVIIMLIGGMLFFTFYLAEHEELFAYTWLVVSLVSFASALEALYSGVIKKLALRNRMREKLKENQKALRQLESTLKD